MLTVLGKHDKDKAEADTIKMVSASAFQLHIK